jgi:hypothetical protein
MTNRMPLIAAIFLLSATAAQAATAPTSTDEARLLSAPGLTTTDNSSSVTDPRALKSTDEVRAFAGRSLPTTSTPSALSFAGYPGSTDEARAMAGGGVGATAPSREQKVAKACPQACACKHG